MNDKSKEVGFTYLGILFVVAFVGIALSATGLLWSFERQREREMELIFIGHEFRDAIGSYYNRSPGAMKRYPVSLDELLKDNRHLQVVRHLRHIYIDPITNTKQWGIVLAPDGGIMGVFSLSEKKPIKLKNFDEIDQALTDSHNYVGWQFVFRPDEVVLQNAR